MPELAAALAAIAQQTDVEPELAIILGSGLGGVVDHIESATTIPFNEIPGFGCSTAGGHRGQLVIGRLRGVPVVAMAGRLHRYGGWTTEQVTFPVRVMHGMGARRLIVSNAAGGVNPKFCVGDIMLIHDHVDWMYGRPAVRFAVPTSSHGQPAVDTVQRRGPIYDEEMIQTAFAAARRGQFVAHPGTYLGVLGPNYETRAEYRMMRKLGADVVGMSTVPEVLVAAELEMRILALSMVSNVACPDAANVANHEEVLAAGAKAEPRMLQIVEAVVDSISV